MDAAKKRGLVYTETVVHAPPPQFAADAPYQVAIIELPTGDRITVRIKSDRVKIGDLVIHSGDRDGVPYYSKVEPE